MSLSADQADTVSDTIHLQTSSETGEQELIMSSAVTDFARRLYNLLEGRQYSSVICWGPERDRFMVKDTNLFSKTVLPRVFDHSNFASFVRQLNKYDFHKVRKGASRDLRHVWVFRHPHFHGDKPHELQHVRRKMTTGASVVQNQSSQLSHDSSLDADQLQSSEQSLTELHNKLDRLEDEDEDLRTRARNLERNYERMYSQLQTIEASVAFRQEQMDSLMLRFGGIPDGHSPVSGICASTSTPTVQWEMRRNLVQSPPFISAPFNIDGDRPPAQQGKTLSIGCVIPTNPSSVYTRLNYGEDNQSNLIQRPNQLRDHFWPQNVEEEYSILEVSKGPPTRATKRLRTASEPHDWKLGTSSANSRGSQSKMRIDYITSFGHDQRH